MIGVLADQVAADVGAVARPLVVVGEAVGGGADRARARRDLDQLEAGQRVRRRRAGVPLVRPARSRQQLASCERLEHRLGVLVLVAQDQLVDDGRRRPRVRRAPRACARAPRRGSRAPRRAAGTAGRRGRRAASRRRRRRRPGRRGAAAGRRSGGPSHRSSKAAMCPRSQTSGLISVEWTRSRSSVGRPTRPAPGSAPGPRRTRRWHPRPSTLATAGLGSSSCSIVASSVARLAGSRCWVCDELLSATSRSGGTAIPPLDRPAQVSSSSSGSSGPLVIVGPGAAAGQLRRDRQEQLVDELLVQQRPEHRRSALAQQQPDAVIGPQLAQRGGHRQLRRGRAGRPRPAAAQPDVSSSRAVNTTTLASGSANSGMSVGTAPLRDTTQAIGSGGRPSRHAALAALGLAGDPAVALGRAACRSRP